MKRQLQFVHIGKCGGSTVEKLLPLSPVVREKYSSFFESHINGVVVDSSCDFLFCLRNPISRAFSAFEWRRKLVLEDELPDQVRRFPGERKVLRKYLSLGAMARSLYRSDGRLDQAVARDFCLVHHLRESISFYLSPLLPVLKPDNVLGVICQETLAADCKNLLDVDASELFVRRNEAKGSIHGQLEVSALMNLRRFLIEDYQCISKLWSLGVIGDSQFMRLMLDSYIL